MYASALDCQGLYTFPNPLSKVPVGALLLAENLTANKDGTAETRRGFGPIGSNLGFTTGWIANIFGYQNRLIVQGSGSPSGSLFYDSTGSEAWTPFASTYGTTSADPYFASVEANKNMYLVGLSQTAPGPGAVTLKMSAYNSEPIPAGVAPGLDGSAALAGAGAGFLGSNFQAAYQVVFGYVDVNGNLNLGNPSERILIVNAGGGSDNVTLTFTVPQGLSTSYFYQIYRTPQTAFSATPSLNVPPGAEPQLAAQFNLTAGQIAALSVTLTDVTPDVLLGAALYTNPSQQGALQTNDRPPFALDAALFSQMLFYANTTSLPILNFSMISVGAPNGVQIGDTIVVNGVTFTAAGAQNNAAKQFLVTTTGTVAQNIDATARALINCINANAATTLTYAFYLSGYNQLPGLIALQSVSGFTNFVVTASRGGAFSPVIPPSGSTFISSTDSAPNGLYTSKVGQPEAVPLVNLTFVGGGDQPILRILALRDRLIVIKTDGVFVVTGSTPQNLSVTLLDSSIICIARGTAKLLNNSVYLLSQQGVVSITESGVTIQSRAIEADILATSTVNYTNALFQNLCGAVAYESERLYILTLPSSSTDIYATQAYCYNWVTNAWTHWTLGIPFGFVNPADNKLYISRPGGLSPQFIYQERKSYTYEDYYDDQISVTITNAAAASGGQQVITLSTTPLASWLGFGLSQSIPGTPTTVILTTGSTFSAQTDNFPITVQCIGGGGGASNGVGGGGGGYSIKAVAYVSGSVVPIQIGQGGSGVFDGSATTFNTSLVLANGGKSGASGGAGGAPGVGSISTAGGAGATLGGTGGGGGGGGAAGPNGNGQPGGAGFGGGGGGGGGNGGGTPGVAATSPGSGAGGNSDTGSPGGAGSPNLGPGNAAPGGTSGTNGSGGGGCGSGSGAFTGGNAGSGGTGTDFSPTAGPGGGGGGVGVQFGGTTGVGGRGGKYGGGAGGTNPGIPTNSGANGIMVITYGTPNVLSAIITAINPSGKTVTVSLANSSTPNTAIPWSLGLATVEATIPVVYQQAPMTGNFPHYMKIWGRMDFWFNGGNFQYVTAGCSSDVTGPGLQTEALIANVKAQPKAGNFPIAFQTIVPQQCSLSRYIMPYLQLAFPRARFSCLGVTVSYEIQSDVSA